MNIKNFITKKFFSLKEFLKKSFKNFKKKKRNFFIFLILSILVIYGIFRFFSNNSLKDYIIIPVEKGEIIEEISETGRVQGAENIPLSFKVGGRIKSIDVSLGQEVQKDQVLATLDANQLKMQLESARAQLEMAKSQYEKLIKGQTVEDIKIYEDAVKLAEQDLKSASASAFSLIRDAYIKLYSSSNLIKDIKESYFSSFNLESIKVGEAEITLKKEIEKVKKIIDDYEKDSSLQDIEEFISQTVTALEETANALKDVRDVCNNWAFYEKVSSSHKAALETQIEYVNSARTQLVSSKETVNSLKIALQKAENTLALRKANPRQEDIDYYLAQIKQAEATVNLYQSQLNDAYLRSPIAGKITMIDAKVGEVVSGGQPIIKLLSLNPFVIKADIYEGEIVKVKIGNVVRINLVAFPKHQILGRVIEVSPGEKIIDEVVYYEVTIDFPNELEGIRSGMTADIVIETNKKENVLKILKSAVEEKNGKKFVWVLEKGKLVEREIETGLEGDEDVEIISGLKEGDKVVIGKK